MKEQTNRPRLSRKIEAILGLAQLMGATPETIVMPITDPHYPEVHASGGLRSFQGNPIYTPKRTKFKGYMRDKSYQAKRR